MNLAETAELVVRIRLKDELSKGIAGIKSKLSGFGPDFKLIGGLAQRGIQTAIANMAKLGIVAGGVVGVAIKSGLDSLADLEDAMNQTEAAIASTGGAAGLTAQDIRDMSEELENLTTVDDKLIQSGANVLLTFKKVGEDAFQPAMEAALDLSARMGTDLQGSIVMVGKALEDPIRGLSTLRRVGIQFTDEQENQIKALVEANDLFGAQTLILDELESQFGGSAQAAASGYRGTMARLGDTIEDLQMALAEALFPAIQNVAEALREFLSDPSFKEDLRGLGQDIAGLFSKENVRKGLDAVKGGLEFIKNLPWSQMRDAFKAVYDAFNNAPEWLKTAVLTGWGLNKLTGGALGGIVGELGKGLIKGILSITAPVVNIKAATVTGVGGPAGAVRPGTTTAAPVSTGRTVLGSVTVLGSFLLAGVAIEKFFELQGQVKEKATEVQAEITEIVPEMSFTEATKALQNLNSMIDANVADPLKGLLMATGTGRTEVTLAFKELAANLLETAETPAERAQAASLLEGLATRISTEFTSFGQEQAQVLQELGVDEIVTELRTGNAATTTATQVLVGGLEKNVGRLDALNASVGQAEVAEAGRFATLTAMANRHTEQTVAKLDRNADGVVNMKEVMAERLGVSIDQLRGINTKEEQVASRLGISVDQLRAIKSSSADSADRLNAANSKLQGVKEAEQEFGHIIRGVRTNTSTIARKDWKPTINVRSNFNVSGRTIAREVSRYASWSYSRD